MTRLTNLSEIMLLSEKYGEFDVLKLCLKVMGDVTHQPLHFLNNVDVTEVVEKFLSLARGLGARVSKDSDPNSWTGQRPKIEFIKELRSASGAGLKEAKDFSETFPEYS